MAKNELNINNLTGGISTIQTGETKDNQLLIAKNMFYNKDKQLTTRLGYKAYLPKISTKPVTSYFFHQKDDGTGKFAIAVVGDVMYSYNEGTNTRTSIKTGLTEFETNTNFNGARTRWDFAVYNNIVYMCNGVDNYASWNGTTYTEYATQPKCRYLSYLGDRVFGAGEDANPITVYYTGPVPANANTLNANFVKVGGDETGAINGLTELGNVIIAVKDVKHYAVNPVAGTATAIDAQGGGFCNRSIKNVGNSIVFFNEKGVDTLKQRTGVTGISALETASISDDVVTIFNQVQRKNYNFQCSMYNRIDGNYYISIDSNNDTVPDTTVVYSSITGSWTTYDLPSMFDMGIYIDNNLNVHYLFAGTDGQMYEFETGSTDYSKEITHEVRTKNYDQNSPGKISIVNYIDLIGYKSQGTNIDVNIFSENIFQTGGEVTDSNISASNVGYKTIGSKSIGTQPLGGIQQGDEIKMYKYTVRITGYISGENIGIGMKSVGGNRTIDRLRIGFEGQPIDVFYENQYL